MDLVFVPLCDSRLLPSQLLWLSIFFRTLADNCTPAIGPTAGPRRGRTRLFTSVPWTACLVISRLHRVPACGICRARQVRSLRLCHNSSSVYGFDTFALLFALLLAPIHTFTKRLHLLVWSLCIASCAVHVHRQTSTPASWRYRAALRPVACAPRAVPVDPGTPCTCLCCSPNTHNYRETGPACLIPSYSFLPNIPRVH